MEIEKIVKYLIDNNITISTMESCTGGLLASLITDVKDASSILKYSAVTYSNEFKIKMGVDENIIDKNIYINLNTCTKEELMTVPNIGLSKAEAIIKYRIENGSFKSIEELKNINGIGDAIFEKIKIYFTI